MHHTDGAEWRLNAGRSEQTVVGLACGNSLIGQKLAFSDYPVAAKLSTCAGGRCMASAMREWPLPNASNRVALRCDDSTRQRALRAPLRRFPVDPGHMRMRCGSRRRDGPMPSHRCGKRMRFNGNMQSVSLVHVPHRYGVFGHAYGRGRSRQIPPGNRTPRLVSRARAVAYGRRRAHHLPLQRAFM